MERKLLDAMVEFADGTWHTGFVPPEELINLDKARQYELIPNITIILKGQNYSNMPIKLREILIREEDFHVKREKGKDSEKL